jgi:hypothetical protein
MTVLAMGTHPGGTIAGPGAVPGSTSGGGNAVFASLRWLLTPDDVAVTSSSPLVGNACRLRAWCHLRTACHLSFEEAWCTGDEVVTPLSQVGIWLQTSPGLL